MDEAAGARPAQWSTAAHRALEDHTLALMETLLAGRHVPAVNGAAVEAALAVEPGLGEDQAAAVRVLAGEGGGLRAVLAPAGYGKTTMLHAAARAAAGDGRPVVAVATTAKAVAELAGAGLDARTIARLRIDLTERAAGAGTVVVLDEISQTPTHEVEAVLAAVDACPGGIDMGAGRPSPVPAGRRRRGGRPHRDGSADAGPNPVGPPDGQPPPGRPRRPRGARPAPPRRPGRDPSSCGASRAGSTSTPARPRPAQAMAEAVCDDIGRYGAEQVAALVVSHTDAEDLADRIRAHLAASGSSAGPS